MTEPKIPKFGSFKPAKPAPTTVPDTPQPTEPSTEQRSERRHRSSGKHEDSRRRHHRRHRSRSQEERQLSSLPIVSSRVHETHELVDIFVVDRKGDEKNLIYGSVHRYNVPPFHRYGAGYVLGLSNDFKIDRNLGDEKGLAIGKWRDSRTKTREKYVFSKVAKERPRLLRLRPQSSIKETAAQDENFIPFKGSKGQRKRVDGGRDAHEDNSDSENDERDYRSIYGKKELKDNPSDNEFQYATESDSSGSDAGHTVKTDPAFQSRSIELSRRVDQSPHDIENWLALIDHQDILLNSSADRRRITNAEIRSTAEIKIHMYEKALEKMTALEHRERLLQGLMAEGGKIWEVKAQSERWQQISNDNIDSLLLWTNYLNFKQSNFTTFRYEEIKELYLSRINLLTRAISNGKSTSIDPLFNQLIYVTLRFTLFARESGYSELAIAIWQAILEVTFFAPLQSLPREEKLEMFKNFWESEVPRLGEEGALGWRHFVDNENSSEVPDTVTDEENDSLDVKQIFESWAQAERLRSANSFPARTMDEVIEDDPFRVILISDIMDYIVIIPSESKELQGLCLNAFLLFCHLPTITRVSDRSSKWSSDSFIRNDFLESGSNWIEHDPSQEINDDNLEDSMRAILKQQFSNHQISPDTMFPTSRWFKRRSWRDTYPSSNGPVPYTLIRNLLKQLTHSLFLEEIAEYHLSFECMNEFEFTKKTSKAVLKRYPSSLRLYNAYGMIEWPRNKNVAQGVFTAALNMSLMSDNRMNDGSILLWKSWIWASIEDGDALSALGLLLSIVDGIPNPVIASSPALLLRSKQHLASNRDFLLSSGNLDCAVMYGECFALLIYLTGTSNTEPTSGSQGDIASALQSYDSFSLTLQTHPKSIPASHELLLQSGARLLLHHACSGPYRPSLLRLHLSKSIALFPQNTIFLSLFTWNERNLRVENRVRNILSSIILTSEYDNIASRAFAINYEISNGTIHSARSAFEHALSSPACKGSAGLWRFYIIYVLSVPQFRGNGKDVWYRALRACPWAKGLYVLGFEKLGVDGVGMGYKEMKSAWRVMGEKELRVHVDLEDKFDEIGELKEKTITGGKASGRQRLGFK